MNKFKSGDFVIPQKFEADGGVMFIPMMEPLIGKIHQIDSVDVGGLYYHIGNFTWPESALTLVNPQTLVSEPARKTFGDFMLAALTGLIASGALGSDIIAERSIEYAKAAFELYEKEVHDEK